MKAIVGITLILATALAVGCGESNPDIKETNAKYDRFEDMLRSGGELKTDRHPEYIDQEIKRLQYFRDKEIARHRCLEEREAGTREGNCDNYIFTPQDNQRLASWIRRND